jgi:carbonic anhydrase/acetyltransferase-like protein (isoleucine patch superfamily)
MARGVRATGNIAYPHDEGASMPRYRFREFEPQIHATTFVADTASLIGHVILAENTSVWPGAVVRAESALISVGEGSNVQDNAVLHTDPGVPMTIGRRVTVGHQVMLHGCTIGDGSLIGIQAIVLNHAVIGSDCLVAAGAVVTERKSFPDRSLIMGAPAKVVRELTDDDVKMLHHTANTYLERRGLYLAHLQRLD